MEFIKLIRALRNEHAESNPERNNSELVTLP
jgi:hypothetical protein